MPLNLLLPNKGDVGEYTSHSSVNGVVVVWYNLSRQFLGYVLSTLTCWGPNHRCVKGCHSSQDGDENQTQSQRDQCGPYTVR